MRFNPKNLRRGTVHENMIIICVLNIDINDVLFLQFVYSAEEKISWRKNTLPWWCTSKKIQSRPGYSIKNTMYERRVGNSERKRFNSNKSNNNYKKIEILPLQNKRPNGK